MHERWLTAGAWVALVLVVGAAAHLMLAACDLGVHPLFGLRYCRADAAADPLAAEREKERILLDRLHEAQLNLSRLPVCLPETPRPEPSRRAENVVPTPTPTPTPSSTPTPAPSPDDRLTIPSNLSDLNGCWQSVRGDIEMITDDAEQRVIGTVRICYCLTGNGQGTTRYIYQGGGKCIGPLRAQLSQDRLIMNHGKISCTGNRGSVVPNDITCSNRTGEDSATCDIDVHLQRPQKMTGEKYRRVSREYCN